MSRRGFGKSPQALPIRAKGKKAAKDKLESYTLCHLGKDGVFRTLKLKAKSQKEALRKFSIFINTLNLCLSGATDEEILSFLDQNPINDGGEA
jgi:hypothetical protein